MRALRELAGGLFIALITIFTVIGGIILAVGESGGSIAQPTAAAAGTTPATRTAALPTEAPTLAPITRAATHTSTQLASQTPTATSPAPTDTETATATDALTLAPSLTNTFTPCAPPSNWVPYIIRRGDTLFQLSLRFGVSTRQLQAANCLETTDIKFGQVLFVPFTPSPTPLALTPTPNPTSTPIPESLRILSISLANVARDSSRPNGAIAFVQISFTGGAPPYAFYDDNILQSGNPMRALTECNGTLIHTARVDSADGQTATQTYYFSPIVCP